MKLDFRGLENLIKCANIDCKTKLLQESVILLKPCYEFYCIDHFRCKLGDCEFCAKNKFLNDSFKTMLNYCTLEKTLTNKLQMCSTCNRVHSNVSEFQLECLGSEIIGFMDKIRTDKDRFKINEPTKKSSYVSLHKKSSQTKTNIDDLDLFVKTVAETTVDTIKKQVKSCLRNKQLYQDLIDQIRKEFNDLNSEIGAKYYQIKLEYLLGVKEYISKIEDTLINDAPQRIQQVIKDYEEGYQRLENRLINRDEKKLKGLKKHWVAESIKLDLLLNEIGSMVKLPEKSNESIDLDEIKKKFGFFIFPIPKTIEAKNYVEFEFPFLERPEVVKIDLTHLDFRTYWDSGNLTTEIYFKSYHAKIRLILDKKFLIASKFFRLVPFWHRFIIEFLIKKIISG